MSAPVAWVRLDGERVSVPCVGLPFRIGRDPRCDLVVDHPCVRPGHAQVRRPRGEYLITPARDARVLVNGAEVVVLVLRPGDEVRLGGEPDAPRLRFEDRMADAFVPPGHSFAEGWIAHPAFATAPGPDAYGPGAPLAGRDPARCRRVPGPDGHGDLVVKVLGAVRSPADGDHHLRLLSRLAGGVDPGVQRVVDGGLAPGPRGPVRWLAARFVEGRVASEVIARHDVLDARDLLGALVSLARGLAHLHARGVRHRDVAPSNVVLRPDGSAALIDPGHAVVADDAPPEGLAVVGTPGYVAPEGVLAGGPPATTAADVYGLAAVGYALLAGRPPAEGEDVLETLALAARAPPPPSTLGVEVPPVLERLLLEALSADPAARPGAAALAERLAGLEDALAVGGGG